MTVPAESILPEQNHNR